MHWILWTIMALVGLTAVIVRMMATLGRDGAKRSTLATKTAWLVAATTSGTMLVFIAAKVSDILPNAIAVDVGALAVAGVLTGLFLAFALMPPRTGAADR